MCRSDKTHFYIISCESFPGWHKIGLTKSINKRLKEYNIYSPHNDFSVDFNILISDELASPLEDFLKFVLAKHERRDDRAEWVETNKEFIQGAVTAFLYTYHPERPKKPGYNVFVDGEKHGFYKRLKDIAEEFGMSKATAYRIFTDPEYKSKTYHGIEIKHNGYLNKRHSVH